VEYSARGTRFKDRAMAEQPLRAKSHFAANAVVHVAGRLTRRA
jgi:hypothetical protein